ncbi:uncharacterized protein EMH_0059020 [Eimeria mitis]|uniref:SAG family member n=1 Tax=Eimeria mitis TaxID=44415 RepID=U6KEY5_9EIME|nr:uncharacterized protein EMH_0059020 [Eimeria mitis]CDJ34033.1 hypothetical protein EMH_0059020 [Eimeria mitis]
MASFYKTATAVCLVALGVLQSEAQGNTPTYKFKVVDVDEDPAAANCTALLTAKLKENFHYSFDYEPASQTSPDYRQLLQDALDKGLEDFKRQEIRNRFKIELAVQKHRKELYNRRLYFSANLNLRL